MLTFPPAGPVVGPRPLDSLKEHGVARQQTLEISLDALLGSGSPKLSLRRTFATTLKLPEQAVKPPPIPRIYRNPVALAQEWQQRINSGEVESRAALARQLGVSRAHVTQVLRLLQLAPQVRDAVRALGDTTEGRIVGAHTLRALARLPDEEQERQVVGLIGGNLGH